MIMSDLELEKEAMAYTNAPKEMRERISFDVFLMARHRDPSEYQRVHLEKPLNLDVYKSEVEALKTRLKMINLTEVV